MNAEQRRGIVREVTFSILALLVSFDLFPGSHVDVAGAAGIAVALLVWGLIDKPTDGAAFGSLIRKAIQSVAPAHVTFGLISTEQSVAMTGLALAIVGTWSIQANSKNGNGSN